MESWPIKPSKEKPTRVKVHNPERLEQTGKLKTVGLERDIQRIARENSTQERLVYTIKQYEYMAPFNYPNVNCELGRAAILILTNQTEHLSAQEMLFQCSHGSK